MVEWLKLLAALPEDLSLILSTDMVDYSCYPSPRGSGTQPSMQATPVHVKQNPFIGIEVTLRGRNNKAEIGPTRLKIPYRRV